MASILAVDDQKVMRDLVSAILTTEGQEITLSEDGVQALDLARQDQFAMVLLDINMPDMNGISLVSWLQKLFEPVRLIKAVNVTLSKNNS